jgi:translation elongation factor EF-Tu-like GTPase
MTIFSVRGMHWLAIIPALLAATPLFAEVRIVVLGVTDNMQLIERWAKTENAMVRESSGSQTFRIANADVSVIAPSPTASLASLANALYQADVAMIVMDTTQGPLPALREHVLVSRQARVPVTSMMLASVDELYSLAPEDAQELLVLEEEEFRNVLALYEMGGADTSMFHDSTASARAPRASSGGLARVAESVVALRPSREAPPLFESEAFALGQVYFLADAESNGHGVNVAQNWSLEMWCEGASTTVDVYAAQVLGPGDIGAVDIKAAKAFPAYEGSRFLLFDNGHIVGLGVLAKLGE